MTTQTNAEVARTLDLSLDEVEALADELGVPDNQWSEADIDDAEETLVDDDFDDEDEEDDEEEDDEDEVEEDDDDDDDEDDED